MSDNYKMDNHPPGLVGGGGKHSFTFKAAAAGTVTIKLINGRSWVGYDEFGWRDMEFGVVDRSHQVTKNYHGKLQ